MRRGAPLAALTALPACRAGLWTPPGRLGAAAQLDAPSAGRLTFRLGDLDVADAGAGVVAVRAAAWPPVTVPAGEPDLPVIRRAMLLPRGASGPFRVVVSDRQSTVLPLSEWGRRVQHSAGRRSLCCKDGGNFTAPPASAAAYGAVYPAGGAGAAVAAPHVWRDVRGAVVEVRPVAVDHAAGTVEVLHSCTIDVVGGTAPPRAAAPLRVDPDFHAAYSFVYANWRHLAAEYVPADTPGRSLVVYQSKFQAQAQKYASWVQQKWAQETILYEGSSEGGIKKTIAKHYAEAAGLSYVVIIGRDVPAPTGPTTHKECDNCYAMLSGGKSLDLFVGRLSGRKTADIETQLSKIMAYDSAGTAEWNRHAHGTAYNLVGDEYKTMTSIMGNLGGMGFSTHSWVHGGSASVSSIYAKMNAGLGVFSYLGHGQGDAWDTPMMSEADIRALTNTDRPFFEIDVSCDNGAFQTYAPCMGEALLAAKGGAIATMMHAPEARGTMCKHYMVQASKALAAGKAARVGAVYFAALTAAQQQDPDDYAVEAYNVFGDPVLRLAFAGAAPAPAPPVPPGAARFHCDTTASRCVVAAAGHADVGACLAACGNVTSPRYHCDAGSRQCVVQASGHSTVAACLSACQQ